MENTELNSQGRSTSQVVEMVGSVILLICLFLPWVTFQMGGRSTFGMSFDTSYSAFDGISLLNKGGGWLSAYTSSTNFFTLLYLVPLLCIINPIVQNFKRVPWLSYYTAWIPVLAGLGLLYGTLEEMNSIGGYGSMSMGIGSVLSLLVGLVMQFSAWTTIGGHYREHRTYFFVVLLWVLIGIGVYIVLGNTADMADLWKSHLEGCIAWTVFAGVGTSHIFFLIYGGIVALVTPATPASTNSQQTKRLGQGEVEEFLNQVRTRTDEELKTILQRKENYNERLVRAAKIIMLERISTPDSSVSPASPASPPVETEDDKYKAYQPPACNPVPEANPVAMPEQKVVQSFAGARDDSFDVIKKSWTTKAQEEEQKSAGIQSAETVAPAVRSSRNGHVIIISILAGVLLAVGGIMSYFFWYAPYVKDRDALRTYVVANNVFLRSSRVAEVEYNILDKVPYGTEVITYNRLGDWAEVKVGKQEGVIATTYLLDSLDFALLNGIWGDSETRDCIESSRCRLAILDYFKKNYLQSGPDAWQFYTRSISRKWNAIFYPRIYDKYSKYSDFVFIIGNHITGNRILVCYSFEDATEKPVFRFSMGAPRTGYIKDIVPRYGGVRVIFDNKESLDVPL